jgi:hypothetical protein
MNLLKLKLLRKKLAIRTIRIIPIILKNSPYIAMTLVGVAIGSIRA